MECKYLEVKRKRMTIDWKMLDYTGLNRDGDVTKSKKVARKKGAGKAYIFSGRMVEWASGDGVLAPWVPSDGECESTKPDHCRKHATLPPIDDGAWWSSSGCEKGKQPPRALGIPLLDQQYWPQQQINCDEGSSVIFARIQNIRATRQSFYLPNVVQWLLPLA